MLPSPTAAPMLARMKPGRNAHGSRATARLRDRAAVFATGARTALGEIAHLPRTAGATHSPLQREVTLCQSGSPSA
jgi:hypothetical protein